MPIKISWCYSVGILCNSEKKKKVLLIELLKSWAPGHKRYYNERKAINWLDRGKDDADANDNNGGNIHISPSHLLSLKHSKPLEFHKITITSRRLVFCFYCFKSSTCWNHVGKRILRNKIPQVHMVNEQNLHWNFKQNASLYKRHHFHSNLSINAGQ